MLLMVSGASSVSEHTSQISAETFRRTLALLPEAYGECGEFHTLLYNLELCISPGTSPEGCFPFG